MNLFLYPCSTGGGNTVLPIDGRNLIFGHKLHIGTPYRGKRFWTCHIPTTVCRLGWFFIHIEHICGGMIS